MDIDRDLDIFGRSYADAAGKFTYRPTPSTSGERISDDASKFVEDMKNAETGHSIVLFRLLNISLPLTFP